MKRVELLFVEGLQNFVWETWYVMESLSVLIPGCLVMQSIIFFSISVGSSLWKVVEGREAGRSLQTFPSPDKFLHAVNVSSINSNSLVHTQNAFLSIPPVCTPYWDRISEIGKRRYLHVIDTLWILVPSISAWFSIYFVAFHIQNLLYSF